jgi:ATP-dependent DNA helicase RecQ
MDARSTQEASEAVDAAVGTAPKWSSRLGPDEESAVLALLRRHYGYDVLRPMQAEAIAAGIARRDSLVVLPTGGGKSLCYQMPPLVAGRLDVVVSPLIALMKDQVDGLVANGYPAAALHSGMSDDERAAVRRGLEDRKFRLLFVSPERLVQDAFVAALRRFNVSSFAIDEAHCISQWGHDFRPEYRQLARLRERFPGCSVHAFTATATPQVREDIRTQLALRDAVELVGDFDRPNLTYRIVPRLDAAEQTIDVLRRHHGEAAIVYCLSRRETESLAEALRKAGISAACYHAGLDAATRRATQEKFADEELDVVVATVAFGMGIDRGDVRCVVHTAMPKSIEHYQQETGRAGRDGLEAECVLLYSPEDAAKWERLMDPSRTGETGETGETGGDEGPDPAQLESAFEHQRALLRDMQRFASSVACRHRALCAYFGQPWKDDALPCGGCDVCLGEVELLHDATTAAQQILSAVARVQQRFGAKYVAEVLHGSVNDAITKNGHEALSVHGLMRDRPVVAIQNLVHQLVAQGLLASSGGTYPTIQLTEASLAVLRGGREVVLIRPRLKGKAARSQAADASWSGVDRGTFEALRALRRRIAHDIGKPPYVVFADETLRAMARVRPSSLEGLGQLRGVGQTKLRSYGAAFLAELDRCCTEEGLGRDMDDERSVGRRGGRASGPWSARTGADQP